MAKSLEIKIRNFTMDIKKRIYMEKIYTINLSKLEGLEKEEIYDLLKEKLHLPNYCGTNLDALYDALTDMGGCNINIVDCRENPDSIKGCATDNIGSDSSVPKKGESYIDKIRKVFEDAADLNPDINLSIISGKYISKYISLYDYEYKKGRHYLNASRRSPDKLVYTKSSKEFKEMIPDAVSCFVIVDNEMYDEPRLLLSNEYRYPTGQFLLSVPAGLIDANDADSKETLGGKELSPCEKAAVREIKEETGIALSDKDVIKTVNPLVFSTPGMTDESNALVSVVIRSDIKDQLSQEGAEGSELFDGFEILTKEEAKKILKQGVDNNGIFYSVYTCIALMYFVSDMWME